MVVTEAPPQRVHAVAEAKARDYGRPFLPLPVDVCGEGQVRQMVARSPERCGRIDVLVNNPAPTASRPSGRWPTRRGSWCWT